MEIKPEAHGIPHAKEMVSNTKKSVFGRLERLSMKMFDAANHGETVTHVSLDGVSKEEREALKEALSSHGYDVHIYFGKLYVGWGE
jgi:ABC-type multidrug transport system fused ATPase/permease subunit